MAPQAPNHQPCCGLLQAIRAAISEPRYQKKQTYAKINWLTTHLGMVYSTYLWWFGGWFIIVLNTLDCLNPQCFNGNFRILKWRHVSTIFWQYFVGIFPYIEVPEMAIAKIIGVVQHRPLGRFAWLLFMSGSAWIWWIFIHPFGLWVGHHHFVVFNGNFRILKWRYVSTIFLAIWILGIFPEN